MFLQGIQLMKLDTEYKENQIGLKWHKDASSHLQAKLDEPRKNGRLDGVLQSFGRAANITAKTLTEAITQSVDRLVEHLGQPSDTSPEQIAILRKLTCADGLYLSTETRVALMEDAKYNAAAIKAAANMRNLPELVQHKLVMEMQHHPEAMVAYIKNPKAMPQYLGELVHHHDTMVRLFLAAESASRMRINPNDAPTRTLFNLVAQRREREHIEYLVPVASDATQLEHLFQTAPKTPRVLAKFVDNPYSSQEILHSISSMPELNFTPGGKKILEAAREHYKRRDAESWSCPGL
jgi:hypothetical protein